ncbi:hypothetical protein Bdiaspc4_03275 [Bradyrhizobium diazoefficiens]|nr:hypothetical protein CO678_08265 [Bradyrhizobium diazoefficiens]QBP19652.1 hypothetical protein Bdiaspc4_03275 [Bradyrhizobium diazoefficiens]QHP67054.1 hypothetical protein EI171_06210 [Bradyrhizobium sp. LCT2]
MCRRRGACLAAEEAGDVPPAAPQTGARDRGLTPPSSRRSPGPITPGRSLATTRRSVPLPTAIDRFRGVGPGFRQDDVGEIPCPSQ